MNTTSLNSAGSSTTASVVKKKQLNSDDFIKMMITQLQNQDPLEPAKNQELMAQMSQIGQMQNSTQLQETLKTMAMQSQIGSAGNLIGKSVTGFDDNQEQVNGVVASVRVEKDTVQLELDSGKTLSLDRVSTIGPGPVAAGSVASAVNTPGPAASTPTAQAAPLAASTSSGNGILNALASVIGG